jgi:hypothetical protein
MKMRPAPSAVKLQIVNLPRSDVSADLASRYLKG